MSVLTACCGHCGATIAAEGVAVTDIPAVAASFEDRGWISGRHGVVCSQACLDALSRDSDR